jgi:CO/xanthine dehydrogenase Mo-binding subunit
MDAVRKLKEIAARDLGGSPDDYDIGNQTVFRRGNPSRRLTYAEAATRATQLGGVYSGGEVPEDLNPMTKAAVSGMAGTGLIGVAKDNLERTGMVPALAVGFVEIELDLETGKFEILDYLGIADCGTVIHPQGLAAQIRSGAVMGFGMASLERQVFDPQYGLPRSVGLHEAKPPSYLDVPASLDTLAVDQPDPQNPVGAKGIGEPVMGCAASALLCAISDALGGHYFNRSPVLPDMILNAASKRQQSHGPLDLNSD